MENKKYKLAILTTHPIPYQVPVFRKLAKNKDTDLMVYFCSDYGVKEKWDVMFRMAIKWDTPLLDGYKHIFLKNYSPFPSPSKRFGLINPGIFKELFSKKYDAIIIHGYSLTSSWFGFLAAWLSKTPIILRGETLIPDEKSEDKKVVKRVLLKILFSGLGAFLPIGTKSRQFYEYYGISREKLFLTPYSVDNDHFIAEADALVPQREALREKLRIMKHLPVILYVGALRDIKNPDNLLKAFESLQEKALLIFIGEGHKRKELEEYVRIKSIKNVRFEGFKNQSELPEYYVASDIFVLPSFQEKWGLVVNEAMCFGLPVVVSSGVTAGLDLVRPGENGFIFQRDSVRELKDFLDKLIENAALRNAMGKKSREIISGWNYDVVETSIINAVEFVKRNVKK
jgi:glycosyltransferase involved in cell wall biosynthesis